MKKTVKVGYLAYTEEEFEVEGELAEYIQKLEDAEKNEDWDTYDLLQDADERTALYKKFVRETDGNLCKIMLNTDKEGYIWEE